MAKKKSERMGTLKKLALWRERDAATAVGDQQGRLQLEQQQLRDLQSYYQDYLSTIDQQKDLDPIALINYRNFCHQLSQTINQGHRKIKSLESKLEQLKNEWLLRRNKRQVLEELILRCEKEESQWLEGELQKEIDDMWQAQNSRNA